MLNRFKPLSKLMYSRITAPARLTWGGAIKNLVIPMIAASVFGGLSNKLIGAFVGNPKRRNGCTTRPNEKRPRLRRTDSHAKHKRVVSASPPRRPPNSPSLQKKNLGQRSDNTPPPIPTNHNAFSRELDEAHTCNQTRPYVANTGIPTQVDDNPMQWEDWAWGNRIKRV
ncbi:MAG: hypothetical protein R2857_10220 [Vampirovibrionales bacterium]